MALWKAGEQDKKRSDKLRLRLNDKPTGAVARCLDHARFSMLRHFLYELDFTVFSWLGHAIRFFLSSPDQGLIRPNQHF